jgi:hypothetical protein
MFKQLKIFFATLFVAAILPSIAFAGPWHSNFQDQKYPSQVALEHYSWLTPAAASAALLKSGAAVTNAAGTTTVTTFLAQPAVPRNIVITTGGTTASIAAGTAVVTGTNIFGQSISENFTISADQNGATTGSKAFKSVTSVVFPAGDGAGATFSVGTGAKLGIPRCADDAGDYVFSIFDGAYESTRGTFAVDSTHVESNTFTPNGSPNGSKVVQLFYVQNYRCF